MLLADAKVRHQRIGHLGEADLGEQYSTIFKDTRDLARVTADMVDAALSGKEVTVNDTKTYNNGVRVVPSYLLKPVVVDKSNWEKVLIDGGYYKRSQFD